MEGFTDSITKVDRITQSRMLVDDNYPPSDFTFDFDVKDGSKVIWHEIINKQWSDQGQVVSENYFLAN